MLSSTRRSDNDNEHSSLSSSTLSGTKPLDQVHGRSYGNSFYSSDNDDDEVEEKGEGNPHYDNYNYISSSSPMDGGGGGGGCSTSMEDVDGSMTTQEAAHIRQDSDDFWMSMMGGFDAEESSSSPSPQPPNKKQQTQQPRSLAKYGYDGLEDYYKTDNGDHQNNNRIMTCIRSSDCDTSSSSRKLPFKVEQEQEELREPIPLAPRCRMQIKRRISFRDASWFGDSALVNDIHCVLISGFEEDNNNKMEKNFTSSSSLFAQTQHRFRCSNSSNRTHQVSSCSSPSEQGSSINSNSGDYSRYREGLVSEDNTTTTTATNKYGGGGGGSETTSSMTHSKSSPSTTDEDEEDEWSMDDDEDDEQDKWQERFLDLVKYKTIHGHCNVRQGPAFADASPASIALALWVKRQRYHYKRKLIGKSHCLGSEREACLSQLGFVWDVRGSAWDDKLDELRAFISRHGHANVPINYKENRRLGIWVKGQRHQYKLYCGQDKRTTLTADRIEQLEALGLEWNPPRGRRKPNMFGTTTTTNNSSDSISHKNSKSKQSIKKKEVNRGK